MDFWTIDIKSAGQTVELAIAEMEIELELVSKAGAKALKIIHGYGSHGKGGAINIAVRKRLLELLKQKKLSSIIYGDEFNINNEKTLKLLYACKDYYGDEDLNSSNPGVTIVVL